MIRIPVELTLEEAIIFAWVGGILLGIILGLVTSKVFEKDNKNED